MGKFEPDFMCDLYKLIVSVAVYFLLLHLTRKFLKLVSKVSEVTKNPPKCISQKNSYLTVTHTSHTPLVMIVNEPNRVMQDQCFNTEYQFKNDFIASAPASCYT